MTRKKNSAKKLNLKEIFAEQEDFLRMLIQQTVQQVLEAEMEEALGAQKGSEPQSGSATDPDPTLGHWSHEWGSLSCGCRKIGKAGSGPRYLSGINAVKKRW